VNRELMVLAMPGSLMPHVNDGSFWLVVLNLSIRTRSRRGR
jgi:hypothetical protein